MKILTEDNFYRHIVYQNKAYHIIRNNEQYGSYHDLEDALYERDRLIKVDWDWDLSMELEETENPYRKIQLPPFEHKPKYIYFNRECWEVRERGTKGKYHGVYYTLEEAKEVALACDGRISHRNAYYEITKGIDGKTRYFGRFKTHKEASKRLEELIKNGWKK